MLAATLRAYAPEAYRRAPVEFDTIDERVADDAQVVASTRGLEVGFVGGDTRVVAPFQRVGQHPGALGRVVVITSSIAEAEAGVAQRVAKLHR